MGDILRLGHRPVSSFHRRRLHLSLRRQQKAQQKKQQQQQQQKNQQQLVPDRRF